jgi:hypothetical protein
VEDDRLTLAPIFIEDLSAIFGGDRAHADPLRSIVNAATASRGFVSRSESRASGTERSTGFDFRGCEGRTDRNTE